MIGERLKLARAKEGLSLRGLAAKMNHVVSAQAIGRYERDECMPSSAVYYSLVEALDIPASFLSSIEQFSVCSIHYRKNIWEKKKDAAKVRAYVVDSIERYLCVEFLLGIDSHKWEKWVGLRRGVKHFSEVEEAADDVRDRWHLGEGPIPHLDEILENKGIKILRTKMSKRGGLVAKAFLDKSNWIPVFLLNDDGSGEQQRLALAHELGHLFLEPETKISSEEIASRFARAFLLPADSIKKYTGKKRKDTGWDELLDIKQIFGIPVAILIARCEELGIFHKSLSKRLLNECDEFGWKGVHSTEPKCLPKLQVSRFERLCSRAYAEETCSVSRARELLNISMQELLQRMYEPVPKIST